MSRKIKKSYERAISQLYKKSHSIYYYNGRGREYLSRQRTRSEQGWDKDMRLNERSLERQAESCIDEIHQKPVISFRAEL